MGSVYLIWRLTPANHYINVNFSLTVVNKMQNLT